MAESKALTIGEMGRIAGRPVHAVDYFLRSRGFKPIQRAGNLRIFSPEALNALLEAKSRKEHPC